jgi:hypothetical protein
MDQEGTADGTTDHPDMVPQAMADWVLPAGVALQDLQEAGVPVVSLEEGNPADMVQVEWALAMAEWVTMIEASGTKPGMKYHHGLVMKKQNAVGSATGG